jgi:hypothetical protein
MNRAVAAGAVAFEPSHCCRHYEISVTQRNTLCIGLKGEEGIYHHARDSELSALLWEHLSFGASKALVFKCFAKTVLPTGPALAPSRLGRRINGPKSWTEYGQGHAAASYTWFVTVYTTSGIRVPLAWVPGRPRPGFLYGLWGSTARRF